MARPKGSISTEGTRTSMARQYVVQTLHDSPGAKMLLKCKDKHDQEVMRVICSTERRKLEDFLDPDIGSKVRISKAEINKEFYVVLTRRDAAVLEEFIRIAPDGTQSTEVLLPLADQHIVTMMEGLLREGLTIEMAESRDSQGIYNYNRATKPSLVTKAMLNIRRRMELPINTDVLKLDDMADAAFDKMNQERMAESLRLQELEKARGVDEYE